MSDVGKPEWGGLSERDIEDANELVNSAWLEGWRFLVRREGQGFVGRVRTPEGDLSLDDPRVPPMAQRCARHELLFWEANPHLFTGPTGGQ